MSIEYLLPGVNHRFVVFIAPSPYCNTKIYTVLTGSCFDLIVRYRERFSSAVLWLFVTTKKVGKDRGQPIPYSQTFCLLFPSFLFWSSSSFFVFLAFQWQYTVFRTCRCYVDIDEWMHVVEITGIIAPSTFACLNNQVIFSIYTSWIDWCTICSWSSLSSYSSFNCLKPAGRIC